LSSTRRRRAFTATYDRGFSALDWEWHPYHRSLLVRRVLSRFRQWPKPNAATSDQVAISLNTKIITSFARLAQRDGVIPLVVHFPARIDFVRHDRSMRDQIVTTLRDRGIDYVDLMPCLSALDVSELFIAGRQHYSPKGNARVAACLQPVIRARLPQSGLVRS
jgi:hypothetical protein